MFTELILYVSFYQGEDLKVNFKEKFESMSNQCNASENETIEGATNEFKIL